MKIFTLLCLGMMVALCVGCSSLSSPSVSITGVHITDIAWSKVTLGFDLHVENHYPVALPLSNLKYALSSQEKQFLAGDAKVQGTIPAGESKTLSIPVEIAFEPMLAILKNVRPGTLLAYHAHMDLSVDAPAVGPMTLPLDRDGELPIPTMPEVELTNIEFPELSMTSASANVNLKIKNTNAFPLDLTKFDYRLRLANSEVADSSLSQPMSLKAGEIAPVGFRFALSPMKVGMAFFQVLKGASADYSLEGLMELSSSFGPLRCPFNSKGQAPLKK